MSEKIHQISLFQTTIILRCGYVKLQLYLEKYLFFTSDFILGLKSTVHKYNTTIISVLEKKLQIVALKLHVGSRDI